MFSTFHEASSVHRSLVRLAENSFASAASRRRRAKGKDTVHWSRGTSGRTSLDRRAVIASMRRVAHEGQAVLEPHENGQSISCAQLTVHGAFGVVLVLERRGRDEPLRLDELAGLGYRHPWAGLAMTIFLLSLAGLPPTAGFFAKFYLFRAEAIQAGAQEAVMYTLAVLTSAAALALALAALLVMAIGILHDPYLALGDKAVASLGMFGEI